MSNDAIDDPVLSKLGLIDDWIESGIVNHDNYLSIKNNYLNHKEEDSCAEHYRLGAFRDFLREKMILIIIWDEL